MAELDSLTSGTQALRPRARILRTFGDELISSETVAVIELVKNAYDADATRVLIRFHDSSEIGKGKLEVIDNGHGMSLETIQSTWMEPATLFRKRDLRSERFNRRVLGEKGIGRFAASRLADWLEVITRREGMNHEVRVFFDWSQYDDEGKYLDQVEVLWEKVDPKEICTDGLIQVLWDDNAESDINDATHGTILRMEALRSSWGRKQFEALRTGISRLISPFLEQKQASQIYNFQIRLELPPPFEDLSGSVTPPEALRSPHYSLSGNVDEHGNYEFTIKLPGESHLQEIKGRFYLEDGRKPQCGPFQIELLVWDRHSKDLSELANQYGSTISNIRKDLDEAAGISIYRDGFRVIPYGDPQNDWLRLDLRRVQNPTMNLSNNQIVGYILISTDSNPNLRDQTNREGLMVGPALDDLRELVKMALNEIEKRRYDLRPRKKSVPRQGGLFADFDFSAVRNLIMQRHPDDTTLLALVGEQQKDLEERVEQMQDVLARYRRLATLGQLVDTVLHEGRAPLSKIGSEVRLGLRDIERGQNKDTKLINRLSERFGMIGTQSNVLALVFRKIEPFGGRKRGRPAEARLEQIISDAFSVLDGEINDSGVKISLPETDTWITADQAEIQEVVINLLQNSLFWLRKVPRDTRQIAVEVNRIDPEQVEIIFADSGPGVELGFEDRIFEPYFSTKPDGIGLGLTIAGEIVSEYYAGNLELVHDSSLPGAAFRITLRRRV